MSIKCPLSITPHCNICTFSKIEGEPHLTGCILFNLRLLNPAIPTFSPDDSDLCHSQPQRAIAIRGLSCHEPCFDSPEVSQHLWALVCDYLESRPVAIGVQSGSHLHAHYIPASNFCVRRARAGNITRREGYACSLPTIAPPRILPSTPFNLIFEGVRLGERNNKTCPISGMGLAEYLMGERGHTTAMRKDTLPRLGVVFQSVDGKRGDKGMYMEAVVILEEKEIGTESNRPYCQTLEGLPVEQTDWWLVLHLTLEMY